MEADGMSKSSDHKTFFPNSLTGRIPGNEGKSVPTLSEADRGTASFADSSNGYAAQIKQGPPEHPGRTR